MQYRLGHRAKGRRCEFLCEFLEDEMDVPAEILRK